MYLAQSGLYTGLGKKLELERVARRIEVDYALIGQKEKGDLSTSFRKVTSERTTWRSRGEFRLQNGNDEIINNDRLKDYPEKSKD
ncbi:hypothetical protein K0M31_001581 [Melipona bicolor]|uniref:Uncharacterized protein n=1 Tax=Melipona bicolor TaxID=60889 RepID=A0AA40GFT3_9HYME|nr:hypothetical protein K0M31_001581 [Melipona bicolor]